MKELINFMSQPIISFNAVALGFFLMMAYAEKIFLSKKILWAIIIGGSATFIWAFQDPNFRAIILWPDNIPIVILVLSVGWFTWFSIHKGLKNDQRIAKGEPPIDVL